MKTETRKSIYQLLFVALLVILLGAALAVPLVFAQGETPNPGTINGFVTYAYTPTTVFSGSGTAYSPAPRTVNGHDVSIVQYYNAAKVWFTADVASASDIITITAQFSADQSNWADAKYTYMANSQTDSTVTVMSSTTTISTAVAVTATASSLVTTTNTYTVTESNTVATTPTEQVYEIEISAADSTDYMVVPIEGKYMRFKIEYSGTITSTLNASLFNN